MKLNCSWRSFYQLSAHVIISKITLQFTLVNSGLRIDLSLQTQLKVLLSILVITCLKMLRTSQCIQLIASRWNIYIINSIFNKTDFYFAEYSNRSYCTISSSALNSLQPNWSYQIVKLKPSVTSPMEIQGQIDLQSSTVTDQDVKQIKQIILDVQEECKSADQKQVCIQFFISYKMSFFWIAFFVDTVMTAKSIDFIYSMNFHFDYKWMFLHNVGTSKNQTYLIYDTPLPDTFCSQSS